MKKLSTKIKSIVDVITNSSTEVFTIYNQKSVDEMKKMFDALLAGLNSPYRFDDLFTIQFDYETEHFEDDMENWLLRTASKDVVERLTFLEQNKKWEARSQYILDNVPEEIRLKLALAHDDDINEGYPAIEGITITVKDVEGVDKEAMRNAAKAIMDIAGLFEHVELYC